MMACFKGIIDMLAAALLIIMLCFLSIVSVTYQSYLFLKDVALYSVMLYNIHIELEEKDFLDLFDFSTEELCDLTKQ